MIISDGKKIKVYNGTATTIDSNKIVVVKGKRIVLASNANTDVTEYPLGYTLSSINAGNYGEVLLEGSIQNINSSSYSDGALLYLSTNGNVTTTKPATSIIIGAVITSDTSNGSIYFKVFFPKTSWGDITGDITNQTDLQNALDDKFDNPTGTTSQYIRGDGSLATFSTTSSVGFEQNFLLMGA
jgi:predicted RecA/RadA family phage recombinase